MAKKHLLLMLVLLVAGCQTSKPIQPATIKDYIDLPTPELSFKKLASLRYREFPSEKLGRPFFGKNYERRIYTEDNKKSVIVVGEPGSREIYLVDMGKNTKMNISSHEADDGKPSVSSNGKRIAFASDRDGDSTEVYVVDLEDNTLTNISNRPSPYWDGEPTISANGNRIAYLSIDLSKDVRKSAQVYVVDLEAKTLTKIEFPIRFRWESGSVYYSRISPDGRKVRFQENPPVFRVSGLEVLGSKIVKPKASRVKEELYEADLDSLENN